MILLLVLLLGSGLLFGACAPQLGAAGDDDGNLRSINFRDGKFHNLVKTSVSTSTNETFRAMIEYFIGKQNREPVTLLPSVPVSLEQIGKKNDLRITWLGHSTCLIEIDGRVILTDPMFSERASPFSFMGPKRFASEIPIQVEELPQLDAVLISHDHYDHMDYQSILALKGKAKRFYVPLGVAGHLQRWGIPLLQIIELDWWEQRTNDGLSFTATPARHFSGRGFISNKTLWASWVIKGNQQRVFFSGDSGYFGGFETIGEKYGPFDVTLLESGAYNKAWADIHMTPEQTVQAHLDLKGKMLLPIHWGKFNLSLHSWTEPIERLLVAAKNQGVLVVTPMQGENVVATNPQTVERWWGKSLYSKLTAENNKTTYTEIKDEATSIEN